MLTFRAGKSAALIISLVCLGACSREQQDWRSAEASDSVESYGKFLREHPDSELVTAARARYSLLSEEREWKQAGEVDTADAYKQFLAQHPNGKWAQEARIRIENFELGAEGVAANAPATGAASAGGAAPMSSGIAGSVALTPAGGAGSVAAPASGGGAGTAVASPPGAPAGLAALTPSGGVTGAPAEGTTAPPTAPMVSGEAAQIPTSPSASAQVPTSPRPTTYNTQTVGTAWRSADSGTTTTYGVQLGAFASENAATSEWEQLTARFGTQLRGLVPHVVSADTTTGHLFRLQALVADEATARALCDVLKKQSQACVPVLPR